MRLFPRGQGEELKGMFGATLGAGVGIEQRGHTDRFMLSGNDGSSGL